MRSSGVVVVVAAAFPMILHRIYVDEVNSSLCISFYFIYSTILCSALKFFRALIYSVAYRSDFCTQRRKQNRQRRYATIQPVANSRFSVGDSCMCKFSSDAQNREK